MAIVEVIGFVWRLSGPLRHRAKSRTFPATA
jgi:hypothetical protein